MKNSIKRKATRITVVSLGAVLSLISFSLIGFQSDAAMVAAADPPPTQLMQAWVFDGAYQSSDVFAVALTDLGMMVHIENAFSCPDGREETTTGFVALSPAHEGVYALTSALPLGFGPALDPSIVWSPPPAPFDPNLVTNDCVALSHEAAVASYISDRHAEIAALDAQLSTCKQEMEALMCLTLEKIEEVEGICNANPNRCPTDLAAAIGALLPISGAQDLFTENPPKPFLCELCRGGLLALPVLVETAQKPMSECQSAKISLQAELNILETFLAPGTTNDPLPLNWHNLRGEAAQAMDAAKTARNEMDAILSAFADSSAPCSHENLVESCSSCDGPFGDPPPLVPTGAVRVEQSARHLGRLAVAFRSAANRTTDANLRARYTALAERLRELPGSRVLNVTAPNAEPFTQSFVALRRTPVPDDGRSPLAVVLTLVGSRRRCPPPLNLADRQLLDQSLETFKRTLAPARPCPTCDPPPR